MNSPYGYKDNAHALTQAIIYTRVSSIKQTTEGDGLNSQLRRCEDHARHRGYEIIENFQDNMSGASLERPGIKAMLSFLKRRKKTKFVIIIDDINRLARDIQVHHHLREAIRVTGAVLESPSMSFADDPDSLLVENLMATVSQHQRQKNAEQVRNRMTARLLNGYWTFQAPMGYRYVAKRGNGKILERFEPNASRIQEAFQGLASGRFNSYADVKRFFETIPDFPRNGRGIVRIKRVIEIINNPIYAGLVYGKKWDIPVRPGNHEAFISPDEFYAIHERLKERKVAPARADLNRDFVLRGAISCTDCGNSLTACWSKGRKKHYAYYLCHTRGCESFGKSIARDKLEDEFETLVKSLRPSPQLVDIAMDMFKTAWNQIASKVDKEDQLTARSIKAIDDDIDKLVDRMLETESDRVVAAFEKKIAKLEEEKAIIDARQGSKVKKRGHFDDTVRTAIMFLLNPHKLWASGSFDARRLLIRLAFADQIPYSRFDGLRTAQMSQPFQLIQGLRETKNYKNALECVMVGDNGLEPLTLSV